jgi:PAP2 superfamily
VRSLINRVGAWLPHGYGDAGKQLSLFVLAELTYEAVRGISEGPGAAAQARANGQAVIDVERSLHTFFEPGFQKLFLDHRWIIDFANFMYMNSHFVVTTVFLVWLYVFRNQNFYFVRNMFMVAMGLAVIGYALLPTMPPRMFDGFTDTITDFSQVNHDSGLVKLFINPYAAIPSMHVAFSTMIGVTGVLVTRHRISKILWAAYPVLVFWVVVVTANHFWIDGAAGLLVAVLAAVAARSLARARPAVWSFRPATT